VKPIAESMIEFQECWHQRKVVESAPAIGVLSLLESLKGDKLSSDSAHGNRGAVRVVRSDKR
jgi:hypothetical protein